MKSNTLDLFWVEKMKLIQYSINLTKSLDDSRLDNRSHSGDKQSASIRATLFSMVQLDRKLAGALSFSVKMSRFLPLPQVEPATLEKELTSIRDMVDSPALPPELSEIINRKVNDLHWENSNPSLLALWEDWSRNLLRIENELKNLDESTVLKLRYFSWRGVFSIPSSINLSSAMSHKLLKEGILKNLSS